MTTSEHSNSEINKMQISCCIIGIASSILVCSPSSGLCCLKTQSNPIILWTGVSFTMMGFSFGVVPIAKDIIRDLCIVPQIEPDNDNNTDISSEISTQDVDHIDLEFDSTPIPTQNNTV